jgi:hypothetical protein
LVGGDRAAAAVSVVAAFAVSLCKENNLRFVMIPTANYLLIFIPRLRNTTLLW